MNLFYFPLPRHQNSCLWNIREGLVMASLSEAQESVLSVINVYKGGEEMGGCSPEAWRQICFHFGHTEVIP